MTRAATKTWPELALSTWLLMGEASLVIWMRSARLMMGGAQASREAELMVTEKIAANMALLPALMSGGAAQTAEALSARTLSHYGKAVRANRRRLSRRSR